MKKYILYFLLCCTVSVFATPHWLLENSNCSLTEKEAIYKEAGSIYRKWSKEKELFFLKKTAAHPDAQIQLYGLYSIGEINLYKKKFEVVEEEYIKQLKNFKDPIWKSTASHIARFLEGKIFIAKNKYAEATNVFLQLIKDDTVLPHIYCVTYAELGYISALNKDKHSVRLYYKKAIEQAEELDNLHLRLKSELDLFSCLNVFQKKSEEKHRDWSNQKTMYSWEKKVLKIIQASYFVQNAIENFDTKNYDTSIELYLKAITLRKEIYPKNNVDTEYFGIAECYFYKEEYKTALGYANKVEESEEYSNFSKVLSLKVKIYRALKEYKQVDYHQEIFLKKQKESFEKEKQENLAKYNKEFETAEKEKLIHEQDLLIAQQNRKNQLYISFFAFFALLLTGLFYNYKRNQKLTRKELEFSQKAMALERAQNIELQKLDDYRSHLFASLSHEFKTPLTLLKTPLEEMYKETFEGNYPYYYGLMLRNTNRLLELVNQMLTLSKLKHGKVNVNSKKLDVKKTIQNIFIQFGGIAIKKGLKLELYAPNKPLVFDMDTDFLEKIVSNLIQNSIKYTEEGGTVLVQSSTTNTHFKLTVKDTGEGIDEENLEHIFEAFYREKAYQLQQKDGVGLGLSIVKELTDLLNGEIDIQSKKNKGTTISIFLPLAKASDENLFNQDFLAYPVKTIQPFLGSQNQDNTTQHPTTPFQVDDSKPILLVLEDNADLQQLIKDKLDEDFQIVPAFNGLEALMILETVHPHLILSDIMMPKMDGIQFLKKVQTDIRLSHIPILLLSALDAEQAEREGLEAGAIDFLAKPVNFQNLRLQLQNVLKIQRQKQQDIRQFIIADIPPREDSKLVSIDHQFIVELKNIIAEHIDTEDFSVEILSKKMNMSRSTLFLKVKKLTGVSVSSFIRKFRLAKAKTFLEQQQGNVSEAAYSVGIYNLSYFTRIFREEFGTTPRKFLNEYQDGKQPE